MMASTVKMASTVYEREISDGNGNGNVAKQKV